MVLRLSALTLLPIVGTMASPMVFRELPLTFERISSIAINVTHPDSVDSLIAISWPVLQELHLGSERRSSPQPVCATRECDPAIYAIRSLTLRHVQLPIPSLVCFRNLTVLRLLYPPYPGSVVIYFDTLYIILNNNRSLNDLSLSLHFTPARVIAHDGIIELPLLTHLTASFIVPDAALILHRLRLPRLRGLALTVYELDGFEEISLGFCADIRRLIAHQSLPLPSCVRSLYTAESLTHTLVELSTRQGADDYFELRSDSEIRTIPQHLEAVIHGIGFESVPALEVDASSPHLPFPSFLSIASVNDWEDLLRPMSCLQKLRVASSGFGVDNLAHAIAPSSARDVICPSLNYLEFVDGGFRTAQCQLWRIVAAQRQKFGKQLDIAFIRWTFPLHPGWDRLFRDVCVQAEFVEVEERVYPEDADSDIEDSSSE